MKKTFLIFYIGILAISCNNQQTTSDKLISDSLKSSNSDHLIDATLWFQLSAEKQASYYQSYNYAKIALDKQIKKNKEKTKKAVILDIDETILDNSPYQGMLIKNGVAYTPDT